MNGYRTSLAIDLMIVDDLLDTYRTRDCYHTRRRLVSIIGSHGNLAGTDHQIYCERGAITVHPARPISIRIIAVTGVSLYGDSIIGPTRIPVSTGIYLIEINENGKHITMIKKKTAGTEYS